METIIDLSIFPVVWLLVVVLLLGDKYLLIHTISSQRHGDNIDLSRGSPGISLSGVIISAVSRRNI